MPRPVPMTRALIVGPRENLEATVESLYGLKLVHIVDHREGEEGLDIGRPLPTASEASEILVKLRALAPKPQAAAIRDFLTQHGFTSVPVPEGDGDPREILSNLLAERERWEARLKDVEERLETLRERYAGFLSAAKAHLEVTVEKAEAPLRFAVTDHAFIVEGWVPTESFEKLESGLGRFPRLFVTELEQNHGAEHAEPAPAEADPPVLLRNPKPLRPFEMLVKLFSTPNYREIDPTFVLTFTFPIFFGLMVGDAGYGLIWMIYGLWLLRRWKDRAWDFWKNLLVTLIWGGFWSLLFGVFFFGDAFGIPFHHSALATTRVELLDWSAILGVNIAPRAPG